MVAVFWGVYVALNDAKKWRGSDEWRGEEKGRGASRGRDAVQVMI